MQLKPYPEYKESGQPLLGKIPAHWDLFRNGRLFSQRNETGFGDLPILEVSLKTGVRVRDMDNLKRKQVMADREKYKRAAQGDIAYNMMRLWQGAIGVAPVDGLVSPAYVVVKPFPEVDCRYFSYLFRTTAYMNEVDAYSRGIVKDRNRLYWQDFKRMPSVVPPIAEQRQIVRFLNDVGSKIHRFIRNKRRLRALLREQVEILAFGTNLNDNVSKNLGWKALFPRHWGFEKAKRIFEERKINNACDKELLAVTQDRGVLPKGMCAQKYVSPGGSLEALKLVLQDDYVISLRSFQGGIEHSEYEGIVSPAYTVIRLRRGFCNRDLQTYYRVLFKTTNFITLLNTAISGIRDGKNISFVDFADLELPVPPVSELGDLLRAFDDYQSFASISEREIELIREYRTRLIADVVTGQVDVRGLEVPETVEEAFPETADELDALDDLDDEATENEA